MPQISPYDTVTYNRKCCRGLIVSSFPLGQSNHEIIYAKVISKHIYRMCIFTQFYKTFLSCIIYSQCDFFPRYIVNILISTITFHV